MADIRCSNCGKNNPDFFDVCQFCQAPLTPDPLLHIGEEPVKKDTGELEGILPDWLKEARQQGKNAEAADDAFKSQTKPKVPKEEPPDLLAGLMSQPDSDEDEVPDWLAGINPVAEKKSATSKPSSAKEEEPSDFFSQFKQTETKSSAPVASEPAQDELPSWMGADEKASEPKDELTDWFSQTSAEPRAPFSPDETTGSREDESWLKNLGAFESAGSQTPVAKEPEDLGWLRDLEASSKGPSDLPAPKTDAGFDFPAPSSDDDLGWLNNMGGTSAPSFEAPVPPQPASSGEDLDWLKDFGGTSAPSFEEPSAGRPSALDDDLSWLNDLGGTPAPSQLAPSQPASSGDDLSWLDNFGGTPAPSFQEPAPAQPSSSDEDLSWLNNLGGTSAPSFEEPAPSQPASSGEDLGWLKDFGGTPASSFEEPAPAQPSSGGEDLDWLSNLGGTPAPTFEEPAVSQTAASSEDLDWLSNLGGTLEPAAAQPSASQDDLDWLSNLGGTPEPPAASAPAFADTGELNSGQGVPATSKPFQTAPLNEMLGDASIKDTTPDWLKSALEQPSMPAPGTVSMDWLSEQSTSTRRPGVPTPEKPASTQSAMDLPLGDSSTSSGQDMDALFMEMPDWLSREPESTEASRLEAEPATAAGDMLSPVELPSWVQAMRPVDSTIDDASASSLDQVTEREGPLAGFRGVIPASPIGSSLRPKAISLKLQITEEQQASASLLEQIIAGETTIQPRKAEGGVSTQKVLRWVLSGLFLIILSLVLVLGLQIMPIHASATHNELSNLVAGIPDGAPVLVVVDYEPSFAGELEASAGPLLDQLALSRHSIFTFVSMSPNGSALVDRIMLNTRVSKPLENQGLGYQLGVNYFNLGFLPGGSAGVLGFINIPTNDFSKYATVILLTDDVETGRVWVEQLEAASPEIADKPLLLVSSAQAGPMLQPYVSSGQVDIMVSGLYDAAKYEYVNNTRPGTARSYWDAFGVGLMMAVIAIVLGSVWSVIMRIRERRTEAEQG